MPTNEPNQPAARRNWSDLGGSDQPPIEPDSPHDRHPQTQPIRRTPGPALACNICKRLLNTYTDLQTGEITLRHPDTAGDLAHLTGADVDPPGRHEPEPVPADQIDAHQVCDFCGSPKIVYEFSAEPLEHRVVGPAGTLVHRYDTPWAACLPCTNLVQARDVGALVRHILRANAKPLDDEVAHALIPFQQNVLNRLNPGRAVAPGIGQWDPIPLKASTLPKVRDRIVRLLDGEDRMHHGLDAPGVRTKITTGLRSGHLYWIDAQFTDLASHAAVVLPSTTLTAHDAPAEHGLIAWADPVGPRQITTAASWTTTEHGLSIIGYRSVGDGLPAGELQQLREQVGWLVPISLTHVAPDQPIDADSPVAIVAATWLLISQKLAETTIAQPDRAIRKAYQRNGQQPPVVRLVQIRGTARPPHNAAGPAPRGDTLERQYRWWVSGFWRNQPYGPKRGQRRLIYIDPHVRGPKDKPIRPSSTVRVLGSIAKHDEPATPSPLPNSQESE